MDLQVITPMLTLPKLDILHLESTDVCQAACPQCGRELESTFDKTSQNHIDVTTIESLLGLEVITNLKKMFMCGNYGDPAAGKNTLEIFQYFRKNNPNIVLGMNTNGGIGNTNWWAEIGSILSRHEDYVIFSIDGLEDTNHIYRKNVNWQKVISNASSFIKAGGQAHWEMLVFEHNEHQIEAAQDLAKSLGFKFFNTKISRRFELYPIKGLNPPSMYKQMHNNGPIECHAIKEKSVYISAKGVMHPCCWLGYNNGAKFDEFDAIQRSWKSSSPHKICQLTCSVTNSSSNFSNQWQKRIKIF